MSFALFNSSTVGYYLFVLLNLDTLNLTVARASFRRRAFRRRPCFLPALIFSKRNLHVCCDATQLDANEK